MTGDDGCRAVRVLIAEDDLRVRAALRAFLGAVGGFEVIGAADNAATAVQLARQDGPSVALVDVLLPDARDGLDVLRALTALRIPALAISINGGMRSMALAAGAYRFLDKAAAPELLLAALREAAR